MNERTGRIVRRCAAASVVLSACSLAAASTVVTNASNQIVYTIDAGETFPVTAAWPTDVAGVVKEGTGTLEVRVANASFAHPVAVNAGMVVTTVDNALGADVVTVADGAAIHYRQGCNNQGITCNRKCKNVRIAGVGPDGLGAIVFDDAVSASPAGDHLLPLVTLTADAMVGGRFRWGVDKFDLAQKTLTVNAPNTYMMFNNNTFVNPGHVRVSRTTFQGNVTMNGGSANTYTAVGPGTCSLNFWGSTKHQYWTLNVVSNLEMKAGGNYSYSRNQNWWDGPVNIATGRTVTVTTYDGPANCVQFGGVVSGGGAIRKLSESWLFFDAANDGTPNTYTGGTILEGGITYFNRPAALAGYDQPGRLTVKNSATAYIAFDSKTGTIGDVEVTSPGWNYTSAPTVWFYTPGRTTAVTCTVTLTEGDLPSGGLVKVGTGEIKLGSHNTYTGETVVSNGTFTLMDDLTLPVGNTLRLAGATATLAVWTNNVTLAGFGGAGRIFKTSANASQPGRLAVTDKLHFDGALLAEGLTLNAAPIDVTVGPNVTVEIANTNRLELTGRPYTLMTVGAASPITRDIELANLGRPWTVVRSDGGTKLKLVYSIGTVLTFR